MTTNNHLESAAAAASAASAPLKPFLTTSAGSIAAVSAGANHWLQWTNDVIGVLVGVVGIAIALTGARWQWEARQERKRQAKRDDRRLALREAEHLAYLAYLERTANKPLASNDQADEDDKPQ